jgi:hypothetical protein
MYTKLLVNHLFQKLTFFSSSSLTHCRKDKATGCCEHNVYFRPGATDFNVYQQIFIEKQLKYLYALFEKRQPKYILDAGK